MLSDKSRYCSDIQSRCNSIPNQWSHQVTWPLRQWISYLPQRPHSPSQHDSQQYRREIHLRPLPPHFNTCTPLNLMQHIWSTYGKMTTSDLTANEERMYTNWNQPTPIETLYEQLTDAQQFAMQGGETIHDSQLVRKGYEIIGRTGLFTEYCKKWRKNQKTNKHSIILNNSSQLLMMIAARKMQLPEVPATARTQSNKSSTIKWITSSISGCNPTKTQLHHQQH